MKRSTGLRHLGEMADECAGLNERLALLDSTLRIRSLWAFGEILLPPVEWPDTQGYVRVACVVESPQVQVAWLTRSADLVWVEEFTRWSRRPVLTMWRSAAAPVWNHHIERPVLLWDEEGVRRPALDVLASGSGIERLRAPAPSGEELRKRLEEERETSLAVLRAAVSTYDEKRWARGNPVKYADAMWEASAGFLDILDALR